MSWFIPVGVEKNMWMPRSDPLGAQKTVAGWCFKNHVLVCRQSGLEEIPFSALVFLRLQKTIYHHLFTYRLIAYRLRTHRFNMVPSPCTHNANAWICNDTDRCISLRCIALQEWQWIWNATCHSISLHRRNSYEDQVIHIITVHCMTYEGEWH